VSVYVRSGRLMSGRVGEVCLLSRSDRRGRFSVGTCSTMSGLCRYVFGEVVSFRNVFGEVWLVWGLDR